MIYIDFDGVILDTEYLLFKEWRKNPNRHLLPEMEKIKYIQRSDWNYIINNSEIINDAIYYINNMDPTKTFILTKIHSQNEGYEKTIWLKNQGVRQSVILVPYKLKKVDVAYANGNILIDDSLRNLREWEQCGGKPILFDIDDDGYDSWHEPNNNKYPKILNLSKFK